MQHHAGIIGLLGFAIFQVGAIADACFRACGDFCFLYDGGLH